MENIKEISIKGYLASRGIAPKSERGGGGMYLSPIRTERTPSFRVDYAKNLWYDFGIGQGGSIVDLVMQMERCTLSEAFKRLEEQDLSRGRWSAPPPPMPLSKPLSGGQNTHAPTPPKAEIISVGPITNRHLLAYLQKRAINPKIAQEYCREVHYKQYGKCYYAIGFQSDGGGWELRNAYYKGGTSPKAPTTLEYTKIDVNSSGNPYERGVSPNSPDEPESSSIDVNSGECLLFEGFMDMLAYLTLNDAVRPPINIVVLNSVGNLGRATPFLKGQRTIHCFLDNDTAGAKALESVASLGPKVVDCSPSYCDFKDVNDYLIAHSLGL